MHSKKNTSVLLETFFRGPSTDRQSMLHIQRAKNVNISLCKIDDFAIIENPEAEKVSLYRSRGCIVTILNVNIGIDRLYRRIMSCNYDMSIFLIISQ